MPGVKAALPFLSYDRHGCISVGVDASSFLSTLHSPVVFVTVAGPTRTGKSFLANQILAGQLTTEETIFAWEDFGQAHAALHAGANIGKVLVAGPQVSTAPGGINNLLRQFVIFHRHCKN